MHRSGTSAVARMLAGASGCSFLEDPDWAMTGRLIDVAGQAGELARWELVKCPRMTEVLPAALAVRPEARAAVLVRDPRDIFCSIQEKVRAGMPTRMLEFSRLGVEAGGAEGFAVAYRVYAETVLGLLGGPERERVRVVVYEQFCDDKLATVEQLSAWVGWPFDRAAIDGEQDRQLAPVHTKAAGDQSIKGPRRWRRDLGAPEQAALEPALAAYEALRLRA